jgi:alkylation response protein AidB-like acyl-CoA dehydrogenase
MHLALTADQEQLGADLRSYFVNLAADMETAHDGEPSYTRAIRRMGEDGWLGLGWPVEYGGQGRGPIDQMIFVEESHWAGVPLPLLTLNSVGPTLMSLGTDEQRQRFLPGILGGRIHFSIGYTEPMAGTDLASLQTRAVRDGDQYVITGEKLYTSAIQYADYVWLAARTDPDAPKHKGLSVFIVPTDAVGFHWTPLRTMAGEFTSSTFYDQVRVPAANLVGEENQGWKLITNQLNHERVAICPVSGILRSIAEVEEWARREVVADGRRVIDQQWVQVHLARVQARAEFLKLLNWKVAWAADKGLNPADASATKVFGTEFALEAYRLLLEIVGQAGYLVLRGRLEHNSRSQTIFTFGGGTNEIQRDIIAMVGLGMPRAPR